MTNSSRKVKWYHLDAVLGRPNHSLQAKLMICTQAELARWMVRHLEQGYTVTLTKVEEKHVQSGKDSDTQTSISFQR